jgi:hypothetical protein
MIIIISNENDYSTGEVIKHILLSGYNCIRMVSFPTKLKLLAIPKNNCIFSLTIYRVIATLTTQHTYDSNFLGTKTVYPTKTFGRNRN